MCFSAAASFGVGGALSATGVKTITSTKKKKYFMVALVPLLFGIQQILEGIQWVSEPGSLLSMYAGYGFLFFAFLLWPTYIPIAVYALESKKKRKKYLQGFVLLGFSISVSLLMMMLLIPLEIQIIDDHIVYAFESNKVSIVALIMYLIATIGSMWASSIKAVRVFGVIILAFALFSWLIFNTAFVSVWCFYAAVMSVLIYLYLSGRK